MVSQGIKANTNARALEIEEEFIRAEVAVTLNATETCDLLKIDRRTLGRLLSGRRIIASRVSPQGSSKLLFRRREVARFLAALES